MSWAKIDDLLPHHPKLVQAGARAPAVYGYYVASINFCRRHFTDGRVTRADFPLIFPSYPRPAPWLLAELERLHFWDRLPTGNVTAPDTWTVHDFLDHNDEAQVVKARLRADAERKRGKSPGTIRTESKRNPSGDHRSLQPDSERIPDVASPSPQKRKEPPPPPPGPPEGFSIPPDRPEPDRPGRIGSAGPEPVAAILRQLGFHPHAEKR